MTKAGKRKIVIIRDRSGSMDNIRADMDGGLAVFLADQAKVPGETDVTLVDFDHDYEVVYSSVPIAEVSVSPLVPRGSTALFDAIGRTVNTVGEQLADTPESERPEAVIFLIITDGMNNASTEFSGAQIKEMVTHQQQVYSWVFTFLGSNQDAVLVGESIGVPRRMSLSYTGQTVNASWVAASANVTRVSTGDQRGYTDEERQRSGL